MISERFNQNAYILPAIEDPHPDIPDTLATTSEQLGRTPSAPAPSPTFCFGKEKKNQTC